MKSSKASSPICINEGSMKCHVFVQLSSHSWKVVTVSVYTVTENVNNVPVCELPKMAVVRSIDLDQDP